MGLKIDTGRFSNQATTRNLRLCELCDRGDVEDEFHFILICPRYLDIRRKFIRVKYYQRPSMFKLVELVKSNSKKGFS